MTNKIVGTLSALLIAGTFAMLCPLLLKAGEKAEETACECVKGKEGATERFTASMVWDGSSSRFLTFGGEVMGKQGFSFFNDVWSYDAGKDEWTEIKAEGNKPQERGYHAACWDSKQNRMWVFGGMGIINKSLAVNNDGLWSFDPAKKTWTQHKAEGKTPDDRVNPALFYYPEKNWLVLHSGFGGFAAFTEFKDIWIYDIDKGTWTKRDSKPGGRWQFAAAFDETTGTLIRHGGFNCANPPVVQNETWLYDVKEDKWTDAGDGPYPTDAHAAVWDPSSNSMIFYGGCNFKAKEGYSALWSFSLENKKWTEIKIKGDGPGALAYHSMALDPKTGTALIFGGTKNQFTDPVKSKNAWKLKVSEGMK